MKLRGISIIVTLLLISVVSVPAQTYTANDGGGTFIRPNVVYIHPISLIFSTAIPDFPTILTMTYERMTYPGHSFLLKPAIVAYDYEGESINAAGMSVGLRRYLGRRPMSGTFLQTMVSMSRASYKSDINDDTTSFDSNLIFYVGRKGRWDNINMFVDFGLGYRYSSFSATDEYENSSVVSGTGLAIGLDFGVGLSF